MRYCFSTQRFQTLTKPIAKIEIKFAKTQQTATQERLAVANNSVASAKKANNWRNQT
jgi:hypothetical protein